jgi:hypothetical protein
MLQRCHLWENGLSVYDDGPKSERAARYPTSSRRNLIGHLATASLGPRVLGTLGQHPRHPVNGAGDKGCNILSAIRSAIHQSNMPIIHAHSPESNKAERATHRDLYWRKGLEHR